MENINMENKVSIILPTYNEKDNVEEVINRIISSVDSLEEIIVVDDNSPDKTWAVVENISKKNNKVKLIKRTNDRGLTGALWTGIVNSKGEYVLWMDCDMGMPPKLIPDLLKQLDNADISVGSRYVNGGKDLRTPFRRITSKVLNYFAKLVLFINVKDLTSGFIAAKKEVFNNIKLKGSYGEYCIRFLYYAKKSGYRIKEVPYEFRERIKGVSKSENNFFKFGIGYIIMILKLRLEV